MSKHEKEWRFTLRSEEEVLTSERTRPRSMTLLLREAESWRSFDLSAPSDSSAWVRGQAFDQESTPLIGSQLIERLMNSAHEASLTDHLTEQIIQLTGHYGVICRAQNKVLICADRLRSFPIFYGIAQGELWVSDDVLWVQEKVQGAWRASAELSLLRSAQLVVGKETLWEGVYQLRAGEVICWDGEKLSEAPAALYIHSEDDRVDEKQLSDRLREATREITARLIAFADGAKIVVPLSGGFDSRLVLAGLVEAGYHDLLAFTYGQSEGAEARVSRGIARALGVEWRFVRVNRERWKTWRESEAGLEIIERARRSGVLYHVQDPIAIEQLVREGHIPMNSVIACGHSGDLHAGSVIDQKSLGAPLTEEGLINLIVGKYFRFNLEESVDGLKDSSREELERMVSEQLSDRILLSAREGAMTREEMIDELERWVWRERVSKFLVQSMRCYETHGLRWWLPLWDAAFTDLWLDVPLTLRGREAAYHRFVDHYFEEITGERPVGATVRATEARRAPLIKRLLLRSKLVQTMRLRARSPMGWYALIPLISHWRSKRPEDHINAHLMRAELPWWEAAQGGE